MFKCKETIKLQIGLERIFRQKTDKVFYTSVVSSYLAYLIKKNILEDCFAAAQEGKVNLREFYRTHLEIKDNSQLDIFLMEILDNYNVEAIGYALSFDEEILLDYILHSEDELSSKTNSGSSTPESISMLALEILDIKSGDFVIDSCSGIGSFLTSAIEKQPKANYMGIELNSWYCGIAALRASLLDNMTIEQGNVFDNEIKVKADKAFSDFPIGARVRSLEGTSFYESYRNESPVLTRGTSADWLYNYRLVDLIKKDGRAVSVMSLGGLWNTMDREIRQFFIQQKVIESIILLPSRLLAYTAIPVAMIVFGRGNDKGIRFIDASKEYVAGRRQNYLSSKNISKIVHVLNTDSEISKIVSYEEISRQEYSFATHRYLTKKETVENGIAFSTVIKSIRRGIQLSAIELDKEISPIPTDVRYIVPANIQNGQIGKDVKFLKNMEQRFERYVVSNGDLVIAKNGYPFKMAIANIENGETLIASGNLYIIELDKSKVNPYYIKAFLESEKGQAELKSILVGSSIPNIGAAQIGTIDIPMLNLNQQNEIATKYLAAMDNLEYLRKKVEKAENDLTAAIASFFGKDAK